MSCSIQLTGECDWQLPQIADAMKIGTGRVTSAAVSPIKSSPGPLWAVPGPYQRPYHGPNQGQRLNQSHQSVESGVKSGD